MTDTKADVKNRIIYMNGIFDEVKAQGIISKLIEFECLDHKSDIIIFIDSYGGFADSFIAMHDVIKLLRCSVATVCIGKAMSAGQMLLISGTRGKRFITPNSRILVHQTSVFTMGKLSEIDNELEESHKIQKILESMILKYTKITKTQLKELMKKDSYLSAKEALELGIVDYIISDPSVLYSKVKIQ